MVRFIQPCLGSDVDTLIVFHIDEDLIFFSVHGSPSVIEKNVEIVDPKEHEHIVVPRSLVRESVPPRRYVSYEALASFIHETSSFSLERSDALMEEI